MSMNTLLNLKTTIPDSGEGLVVRKKLFDKLDTIFSGPGRFLLVSAPAGYGKTTLISEWLRNKGHCTAWFTVTKGDSESISFFSGIITALQKIKNNIFKGTENILKMPVLPGVDSVIASFIDEIKLINNQFILVIDDFQLINNDYINQFLIKFIQFMPENIFLVILTREDPPLMLNRYRINGYMSELRADDLCFNIPELIELYNNIMTLNIDESTIKKIYKKSEGWVSGAKLVGLKLKGKDNKNIQEFITNFSGSHYYIIDYLVEEVLSELDDDTKQFLYKVSIVEKFCPELCKILTGREDSSRLIKKLEKMNMFILPLDSNKEWFRFHQLFRDSLITNLSSSEKRKLHIKAAEWLSEKGLFEDAVQEALIAEDYKLAVKYITTAIPEYLENGELKILLGQLDKIPDEYLSESILLLIMKAWLLFVIGNKKDALYYIDIINKKPEIIDDKNKGRLLTLTSLLFRKDDDTAPFSMAEEALSLIDDEDKIFKINGLMSLGQIQAGYGKIHDSVESFQKAYYLGRETGQVFMEIMSLMNLALKLNQLGHLQEALTLCEQNINRYKKDDGYLEPLARLIFIPLGILQYYTGQYQKAKGNLISGIEISEQLKLVHVSWMPKIYYALSCFELGQKELAYEIIDETLEYTRKYNLKPNYLWAETIKIDFNLRSGNTEIGKEKINSYINTYKNELPVIKARILLTLSRIFIKTGKNEKAIKYLESLLQYSIDHPDKITANLLLSLAHLNINEREKAEKFFLQAMQMSNREGYLSPVIYEGKLVLPLLSEFRDHVPGFINEVESIFEVCLDDNATSLNMVEPLTEREIEIINLVAEGLANKKIAEELFITEGTTKWHLSNIYSKLGVKNRTRAVAKARDLGIIK